jgi:CRISPR-associated RAMP protein (TIGR02581 family)
MSNYTLQNRHRFRGTLEMQTALHIGGGRVTSNNSNSPVVLTPEGVPFIPGSSFKGALRSVVEKFVPLLPGDFFTCALLEPGEAEQVEGKKLCSTARQQEIAQDRREKTAEQVAAILEQARKDCCDTCKLFGSPFAASRVSVKDLYISEELWSGHVEIRDGVAIDRDTEKAKDRLKYNYEVVPAGTTFALEITLENATEGDLQLLSVGLSEFVAGSAPLGGKRSRGLGACMLHDLQVASFDLTDEKAREHHLRAYLLKRDYPREEAGDLFLENQLSGLFSQR